MREFTIIGFCGKRVWGNKSGLLGFCTRAPGHRGGCTTVLLDPRDAPHGHVVHNVRA